MWKLWDQNLRSVNWLGSVLWIEHIQAHHQKALAIDFPELVAFIFRNPNLIYSKQTFPSATTCFRPNESSAGSILVFASFVELQKMILNKTNCQQCTTLCSPTFSWPFITFPEPHREEDHRHYVMTHRIEIQWSFRDWLRVSLRALFVAVVCVGDNSSLLIFLEA